MLVCVLGLTCPDPARGSRNGTSLGHPWRGKRIIFHAGSCLNFESKVVIGHVGSPEGEYIFIPPRIMHTEAVIANEYSSHDSKFIFTEIKKIRLKQTCKIPFGHLGRLPLNYTRMASASFLAFVTTSMRPSWRLRPVKDILRCKLDICAVEKDKLLFALGNVGRSGSGGLWPEATIPVRRQASL